MKLVLWVPSPSGAVAPPLNRSPCRSPRHSPIGDAQPAAGRRLHVPRGEGIPGTPERAQETSARARSSSWLLIAMPIKIRVVWVLETGAYLSTPALCNSQWQASFPSFQLLFLFWEIHRSKCY